MEWLIYLEIYIAFSWINSYRKDLFKGGYGNLTLQKVMDKPHPDISEKFFRDIEETMDLVEWNEELFPIEKAKVQGYETTNLTLYCFKQIDLYKLDFEGMSGEYEIYPQIYLVSFRFYYHYFHAIQAKLILKRTW